MLNRRAFMRELSTEIERSLRYGRRFVLALCDLDDFKRINDTDGHPAGDRALEAVAALLEGTVRASDFAFRIGGDEFALLLPETDAAEAQDAVGRIVAALAGDGVLAARAWASASASRCFPVHGKTPEELIRRADQALYAAKRSDGDVQLRAARRLSGHTLGGVADPGHVAVGTWSGGRFMHFGEAIDDERLAALLRPGDGIDTVLTADAYGAGEADELLGRALAGVDREAYCLVGAVGHDFYEGEREGSKGFPRFTDPRLRGPDGYAAYLRMATERSLERIGVDRFDLLLLHNPDRIGYTSPAVWEGMAALRDAGLTRQLGVAPGPANGFTLDVIDCLERFGALIDWAMVILNPLEPWPGELVLPAARRYDIDVITRVVDYGGLFWDDVRPGHAFAAARPSRLPSRRLGAGRARAPGAHAPDRRAPRADGDAARLPVEPGARPACAARSRRSSRSPPPRSRSRPSAPSSPPSRASSSSPTTSSPRSARSATTPAAWRSRAPRRSSRASRSPTAGR